MLLGAAGRRQEPWGMRDADEALTASALGGQDKNVFPHSPKYKTIH